MKGNHLLREILCKWTIVAKAGTTRTREPGTPRTLGNANLGTLVKRELRGSRGMGVVSNSWSDRVSLSIIYMFKPSC